MYVHRILEEVLVNYYQNTRDRGSVVAGIVGAGKTTLIRHVLETLKPQFETFEFTGDDVVFRQAVQQDTTYLHKSIRSLTQKRVLVLIDEAQKSELLFDAVKYAFDQGRFSFIISGSNPDYLNTVAKRRLQRRAEFFNLQPFSLSEILYYKNLIKKDYQTLFYKLCIDHPDPAEVVQQEISLVPEMSSAIFEYVCYGGLPLAFFSKKKKDKLIEIRNVVERGFESTSVNNEQLIDTVRVELAKLDSQEFSYQGIFKKAGTRRRDIVNAVIDQLINHGYLLKRKPVFLDDARRSYLSKYSWIDSGIVSYLTGKIPQSETDLFVGSRIESIVACKLAYLVNINPIKQEVGYYRPYIIERSGDVKFLAGEIDFIYRNGHHVVPIEVKATQHITEAKAPLLERFVHEHKLKFGIVLYGGVPFFDSSTQIVYWPFWL